MLEANTGRPYLLSHRTWKEIKRLVGELPDRPYEVDPEDEDSMCLARARITDRVHPKVRIAPLLG